MLAIDLVIALLIVAAALVGARLGLERALPVAGAAAGVLLGSRVPLLVGQELDSDHAVNIAVPAALVLGGIGVALGDTIANRASGLARRSLVVDTGFGAILTGAAAAVVMWALAPGVSEIRPVRDDVRRSEVLERFNAVLTPVRPAGDRPAPAPDAGRSARRRPRRAMGEPRLRARPEVRRAERSLVKVVVTRCGGGYQGTGWIAGHGIVVTNAHVVSGAQRITVSRQGGGTSLGADVIWFDGIHDLALLRVGALRGAPALALAAEARASTPAVSLGFIRGRLTIRRAQLQTTTTSLHLPPVDLASRAGISLTMENRLVTVLRGRSGPGGSGSPVVDRRGHVVGTVFAGIAQNGIVLTVPNRLVRSALRRADHPVEVPSCDTPQLKPTRKESIAARNA